MAARECKLAREDPPQSLETNTAHLTQAEKGFKHNVDDLGISHTGKLRAAYLAGCMSGSGRSLALPSGAPTVLVASKVSS